MTDQSMFPPLVLTLWKVTVLLALVVLVPLSVYSLHALWRAASSTRAYARDALVAAQAIEVHTRVIPALNTTIGVATEVLTAAGAVAGKLDTIAGAVEARDRERP